MQLLENIITPEDIAVFKQYWEDNNHLFYINSYAGDNNPNGHISNYSDKRVLIAKDTAAWNICRRVVDAVAPAGPGEPIWCNYQRQSIPHRIHVDEYGTDRLNPTWTIIFAMDDRPKFKAVIFKEQFNDNNELINAMSTIDYSQPEKNNTSITDDMDHMDVVKDGKNYNFCHWLNVDGVFVYKAGNGVLFDTNQAHSTSNWRKYPEFEYRDLVQIHFGRPNNDGSNKYGDEIPSQDEIKKLAKG